MCRGPAPVVGIGGDAPVLGGGGAAGGGGAGGGGGDAVGGDEKPRIIEVIVPGVLGPLPAAATPELDSLALLATTLFGSAGYALTRFRATRRNNSGQRD